MNKQKLCLITLLALTVSMFGITMAQAQTIQDSAMCYGYGTDLLPDGIGNTVFQYTDKIGLWVQLKDPANVDYRIVWEEPSGTQFKNTAVTVVEKSGEDWGIVFDSINIAETTARNKLGVWTVTLFIDNEVELESNFQIIDYEDLIDNINNIQGQIEEIVDEKDELLAQNAELQQALETLQADYAKLESQVGTSSDYEKLQDNYDELNDDYETLKASQGSTRTMMYAAIVVALVSVVVAVYFGALKK
jgi:hypothetical protein